MQNRNKEKSEKLGFFKSFYQKYPFTLSLILFLITTIIYLALQPALFEKGVFSRLMVGNFRAWLPVIFVTIGQAIVIIGGGLDLSNGAIVSLGNVILALTISTVDKPGFNLAMVALVLLVGLAAGFLNGFFTAYLGLQPVIITFASSYIFSGIALLLLPTPGGSIPRDYTDVYRKFTVLGIPITLIIIVLALLIWTFFRYRKYGRFLFAVGGNAKAAYSTGVPVTWLRISTYMISGLLASLGAISYTLLTGSGLSSSGNDMTLASVTGSVLGGISMSGGSGSVLGSVFGAIVLGNIRNVISGMKINPWYYTLTNAAIIVIALAGPGIINLVRGKKHNDRK